MPFDPRDPNFWDEKAVDAELRRVTELCDGCRRCHRLCPSFDHMLERVDAHDGDHSKITPLDFRRIVDLCWQCKLCFNHCPYSPPHKWDIDFPRLMLRAKAVRAKNEGVSAQDRWLAGIDTVGPIGSATAPITNWVNRTKPMRVLLETAVGVHRDRILPTFHHKTFSRWFRERGGGKVANGHKVALFHSCSVNYNEPEVGRDTVAVLEKNGCSVSCPEQVCCGMPYLDGGDIAAAMRNAERNVAALLPAVEQGAKVVVPQPTCSYVLKKEYPMLVPGAATEKVAAAVVDTCEYLVARQREGTFDRTFDGARPGKVAYQAPCHLRAQNMGHKTRDVLELIPGTTVAVVEKCTAMDGTWAMKKEFYPISLGFAKKAATEMEAAQPETYVTDCSLSALQIQEIRGEKPKHPLTVLREAYGLKDEH